ncbi:MAG: cytochrome ubiquinol oxidase subunit I [Nitrospirota bacterium]
MKKTISLLLLILLGFTVSAHAAGSVIPDYRDLSFVGSRNAVWIIAQVHLLFASFVLGIPIFALLCELIGYLGGDKRYDKLAKEFTKLLTASFGTTAMFGGILIFLLLVLYPKFFSYLTDVFYPTFLFYAALFVVETIVLYIYWYGWEAMQGQKKLHLFLGFLLNVAGILIMYTADAWLSFQASPVVLAPEVQGWDRVWAVIHNPTWNPVNIHRLIGNVVFGGFMCGAYAGVKYLSAQTQEEREHYDWMGYVGNFIGIFGLLPLPFAGYWLMREIYEYNQQMGITLMGGFLSWLFILQAVLIGTLFLGANYYLWQGLLRRTSDGMKYQKYITIMLVTLLCCFMVWMTPHSLVASVEEARKMGGSHHPILGVFGVMSAKLTAVNIMILTTFISFLLYWRANQVVVVSWAKVAKIFEVFLFVAVIVGVIWLGVYGYFVPAVVRVNILSVTQVLLVLFVLVSISVMTTLLLKNAKMTGVMKWGNMTTSSQYALVLNAVMVVLLMTMMGYARSASRVHWHIYGVMRDASPYAFTPALGPAAAVMSLCAFIFAAFICFIFWLSGLADKKAKPVMEKEEVTTMVVAPSSFGRVAGFVVLVLVAYTGLAFSLPQRVSMPPVEEKLDLTTIKSGKDLADVGNKIFFGKGQCALCHTIGGHGGRCPNLAGAGARLTRQFIYETLTQPKSYVKLDFDLPDPKPFAAEMPTINKDPIGLNPQELLTVISFIQSQGGKITVKPAELATAVEGQDNPLVEDEPVVIPTDEGDGTPVEGEGVLPAAEAVAPVETTTPGAG